MSNPGTGFRKGGGSMTIEELKFLLDTIPNTGAINKARRKAIQKQIFALLKEGKA